MTREPKVKHLREDRLRGVQTEVMQYADPSLFSLHGVADGWGFPSSVKLSLWVANF